MASHPASDTLKRAIKAHQSGQSKQALALAEASWRMIEEIPGDPPEAGLVASWYGFLLANVGSRPVEGLALCRKAVDLAFWEPTAFLFLTRLELEFGSRDLALRACHRGLALAPDHRELQEMRERMGFRRPPALKFLARTHPINRMVGRWSFKREVAEPAR